MVRRQRHPGHWCQCDGETIQHAGQRRTEPDRTQLRENQRRIPDRRQHHQYAARRGQRGCRLST
nr:MAG TPA: hypothetical protein [Caudoviricetes sp.]